MKTSKMLLSAIAAIAIVGCQHMPPNQAMEGSGWTQGLQSAGISGAVDDLSRPRDYTVHQVSGSGHDAMASGEGGTVLADLSGPGCVLRFYAANPEGRVQIYVDGVDTPQYNGPFANLFLSTFSSFGDPLTDVSGGGSYTYVPIPYASSCKIVHVGDAPAPAYQVTYASFPSDQSLHSFMADTLDGADKDYFARWSDQWDDGTEIRRYDRETEKMHNSFHRIFPHNNSLLWKSSGPGTIMEIEMRAGASHPTILRHLWLAIYWDDKQQPGVLAPLGGLFGSVLNADESFGGPIIGQEDGRMYIRFPMPFYESAEFRIINETDAKVDLEYWITWKPGAPHLRRYFHARYNEGVTEVGKPYTVAEIDGRGHYVGCTLAAEGGNSYFNLGGRDEMFIDGSMTPSLAGTTTGAYFNSGWEFDGETYSRPCHGLSAAGSRPGAYHVSAYRVHFADAVPFEENFKFTFNHGPKNTEAGLRYASVAFWYSDKPHRDGALWRVPGLMLEERPAPSPAWSGRIADWGAQRRH